MSAARDTFAEFVAERLAFVPRLRIRRMFGGYGIYRGETMFAIIVDDRLYLKTDETTKAEFEAAGSTAFTYSTKRGRSVSMSYFEAPPDVFDTPDGMRAWAQKALDAAGRKK